MPIAEQRRVLGRGLAAVDPVDEVMGVAVPGRVDASGEPTTPVTRATSAASHGWWDRVPRPTHIEWLALRSGHDSGHRAVAERLAHVVGVDRTSEHPIARPGLTFGDRLPGHRHRDRGLGASLVAEMNDRDFTDPHERGCGPLRRRSRIFGVGRIGVRVQRRRDRLRGEISELPRQHPSVHERLREVQAVGYARFPTIGASQVAEVGGGSAQAPHVGCPRQVEERALATLQLCVVALHPSCSNRARRTRGDLAVAPRPTGAREQLAHRAALDRGLRVALPHSGAVTEPRRCRHRTIGPATPRVSRHAPTGRTRPPGGPSPGAAPRASRRARHPTALPDRSQPVRRLPRPAARARRTSARTSARTSCRPPLSPRASLPRSI